MDRRLAFVRHVPPRRLFRRAWLVAKRRLVDRGLALGLVTGDMLAQVGAPLADPLPHSPCVPKGEAETTPGGSIALTFLNERQEFALPVEWNRFSGDPARQLWMMNLHYMEYLPALPDELFQAVIRDWIAAHVRLKPGYWADSWNSYTLSIRIVVWMQEIARRRDRLDPDFLALAARSIASQVGFLVRNLETDIGGNHLIKNIKALAWASAFFASDVAKEWRSLAIAMLRRELPVQILRDGVHYERSPSYHAQVFADLIDTRVALGNAAPAVLIDALDRMAQAVVDLTHPDGGPALFNDAGLTMALAPADCLTAFATAGGVVPLPRSIIRFPDAGYFGVRSPDYYLIGDAGRIGPDELPAHSHGDIGSFELSVAGHRMIVDQGVFQYVVGELRDRSRSAANHNVLHIAGRDQAEFFGAFRCGRRPAVEGEALPGEADGMLMIRSAHDGYGIRVEREIRTDHRRITITDTLGGDGARTAASATLLLHPNVVASPGSDGVLLAVGDARAIVRADAPVEIEPAVHWPDMGVEGSTSRLRFRLTEGRQQLVTTIEILSDRSKAR